MTVQECIKEITSSPKWYIGVMPQSTASSFLAAYRSGVAKKKTIDNFLMMFGYELKEPEQWIKKP